MKRIMTFVLAIVFVIVCNVFTAYPLAAEEAENFTFTLYNSQATITGYTGSESVVTIPETINGYPVTRINSEAFSDNNSLTSLSVPKSVTNIVQSAFFGCTGLKEIIVDPDNKNYTSLDGVLFNKNLTILLQVPEGKTGSYTVP